MDFQRKILILFIIIICIYIIIRLIIKRVQIKQEYELKQVNREGYENSTVSNIQNSYTCDLTIKDDLKTRLNNVKTSGLKIINYAIKASMNTAYDGTGNNTDMINFVLSRGCRYLDFEVYRYTDANNLTTNVVSISKNKNDEPIPLDSGLTISDALHYVSMYSFNSTCPNSSDPLFIQIRLKCKEEDKPALFPDIYNNIIQKLNPRYIGKVTKETSMKNLLGKVIIVMSAADITYNNNLDPALKETVNIYSNTLPDMQTYPYLSLPTAKINILQDMYSCDFSFIRQVQFSTYTNVDSYDIFNNYTCHIIPMMFWDTSSYLCNYENLFNKCGGGIIPLSCVYNQLKNTESTYIAYPDPIFASSNYNSPMISIFVIITCLGIVGLIVMKENQ